MDGLVILAKYYHIHIPFDASSIVFFHNYQKLVKDSQSETGLDPYPVKHIGNLDVFFKAMSKLISKLIEAVIKAVRR